MKRVLSILAALILAVGLSVGLAAWWQLERERSELAEEIQTLRKANADKVARLLRTIEEREGSLRDQELDYATRLRELARKDSELNAFLKSLLAETASSEKSDAGAPEAAPLEELVSDEASPEPEPIEFVPRQELSWQDDHNADGVIDGSDVAIVHNLAGNVSKEGDEDFDPAADLDGDGVISINDAIGLWDLLQKHGQPNSR
jgi:hypothetical protein